MMPLPPTSTLSPPPALYRALIVAVGTTVNVTPVLATPPTVTVTLPVVAPPGTGTVMLVADHAVGVAVTLLNVTVLVPCGDPKFVPMIVTDALTAPLVGDSELIVAVGTTVNVTPLLATPPTVTDTFPVVAPLGTGTVMLVADHAAGVAVTPLNVTVLVPCGDPKLVPVIVTVAPTAPLVTDSNVIVGVGTTVNVTPVLATPPTVTVTLPVVAPPGTGTVMLVADHAVGVAVTPLNVTVLVPCGDPKLVPVIVTVAPTAPLVGDSELIVAVGTTVNVTPLLATPPTVTVTLPYVAPLGTGTVILVADHAAAVAATPLNFPVLQPW